jgi:hypothetical protein
MSSKTKNQNQKVTSSKPEDETGDEELASQADTSTDEPATDETQQADEAGQPAEDSAADATSETDAGSTEVPGTIETAADDQADLATRVGAAVKSLASGANPDAFHALHKAEMVLGDLKTSLPAAIEAADESLKADLQSLLELL